MMMQTPAAMAMSPPGGEPEQLLCPITRVMFKDPVFNEAGNTYERAAIVELWKRRDDYFDPLFNSSLKGGGLWPNWDKRRGVQDFLAEHRAYVPEGWESREVPAVPADDKGKEGLPARPPLMAMCPKRRSMQVIVMALGCLAVAVGSLIVEFTCLSDAMGKVWPCSRLDAVLHRYSAWYFAPISIILGGVIVGGCLGVVAGIGLVSYICTVWLLHLLPSLAASVVAHCRGRQAMAHAQAESQRIAQARLLAQAELDAQARIRAQERAAALLEHSLQSQTQQAREEEFIA